MAVLLWFNTSQMKMIWILSLLLSYAYCTDQNSFGETDCPDVLLVSLFFCLRSEFFAIFNGCTLQHSCVYLFCVIAGYTGGSKNWHQLYKGESWYYLPCLGYGLYMKIGSPSCFFFCWYHSLEYLTFSSLLNIFNDSCGEFGNPLWFK